MSSSRQKKSDSNKREESGPDYYIVIAIFIIILVFGVYLIFISNIGNPEGSINCAPGQCVTNIYSGIKNCPEDDTAVLSANLGNEVCNSPFTCESPVTPYAVLSDGSTTDTGVCDPNSQCRCLQKPTCADYVTAYFTPVNGNAFQPINIQRISFEQVASYIDQAEMFQQNPPLTVEASDFCAVPKEWVDEGRIWPAECIRGTLAFVPEDPANFTQADFDSTPLSCVLGTACPSGSQSYWDNRVNDVRCLPIS